MATTIGPAEDVAGRPVPWLFSRGVDLAAFGGSGLVSLALLAIGAQLGILDGDTPEWGWIAMILLVDVAHVYSTAFRVYFDLSEFRRRPALYIGVPLAGLVISWALYSEGEMLFWRVLAYLAVFHFVRQQYGWMALYRSRGGDGDGWTRWVDTAAIYLATVFPLVYWHSHLDSKAFQWFRDGDFVEVPGALAELLEPVYWLAMVAYGLRSVLAYRAGRGSPGKDLLVVTTAVCWYVGIVTFDSDYAFTVTNVIIHGVPYVVLVFWTMQRSSVLGAGVQVPASRRWVVLLATIWLLAYAEELVWHHSLGLSRGWLFGTSENLGEQLAGYRDFLVPLLAVPQLTHYVLDGFIWKRRTNPTFRLVPESVAPRGSDSNGG